jgi:hypothetical protein
VVSSNRVAVYKNSHLSIRIKSNITDRRAYGLWQPMIDDIKTDSRNRVKTKNNRTMRTRAK